MEQAAAAARALLDGVVDDHDPYGDLEWALETSIVISYMRAFSSGGLGRLEPEQYVPHEHERLHERFKHLRDKVYAHTDARTNREVTFTFGAGGSMWTSEVRPPLERRDLEAAIRLFEGLQDRFRSEIFEIQDEIDGTSWS